MRGLLKVVEPAEFRAYLKERTKSGPGDTSGYE
jgi:hypothetical protein